MEVPSGHPLFPGPIQQFCKQGSPQPHRAQPIKQVHRPPQKAIAGERNQDFGGRRGGPI